MDPLAPQTRWREHLSPRFTMARAQPRKRLNLSPPVEEEGWTTVQRKKRRPDHTAQTVPEYRVYQVLRHEERSTFLAVRRLEREHPELRLRVHEKPGGLIYLKPLDEETAFSLARFVREKQSGVTLAEVEGRSRGVVLRYPVHQSLDPILGDPRVTFARRCTYNAGYCRREPTRKVEVTFRGTLPESLDLGSWGEYSVRSFAPEPLRCFNCHAFGHVQRYCRRRALCGVCSGRHPSSECLDALKAGNVRAARCPNCGGGHHAWHKGCPERLRRTPLPPRRRIDTSPLECQRDLQPAPAKVKPASMQHTAPPPASPPPAPRTRVCSSTQTEPPATHEAATQAFPRTRNGKTQTPVRELADASSQVQPPRKRTTAAQTEPKATKDAQTGPRRDLSGMTIDIRLRAVEEAVKASPGLHTHYHRLKSQGCDVRLDPVQHLMMKLIEGEPISDHYGENDILPPKSHTNKKRRT